MVIKLRLAAFQAEQTNLTTIAISTQTLSFAMLSDAQSVATFWSETSFGHIDLTGSEVLPDTSFSSAKLTTPTTEQIIEACVAAIRAGREDDPLAGFDGVLIVVNPGTFTYANPAFDPSQPVSATNARTVDRDFRAGCRFDLDGGRPAIAVPASTVTFRTLHHEVGHALGLGHPVGLWSAADDNRATAAVELSDEYGSPYDVMGASAQTDPSHTPAWWTYDSSTVGTALPGWAGPLATRIGPHLSRAHLHWHWPEAMAGRVVERPVPFGETTAGALLTPGKLLVMRSSTDATDPSFRTYVEYRDATGWDAGLAPAGDSSGEGVVVHQLRNTTTGLRLCYAGAVRRHAPDADVEVNLTGMTVTVTAWNPGTAEVRVSVHDNAPRVEVAVVEETGATGAPTGIPTTQRTPCGGAYETGTWQTSYRATYAARAFGVGDAGEYSGPAATLLWTIGGQPLVADGNNTLFLTGAGGPQRIDYAVDRAQGRLTVSCGFGVSVDAEVAAVVDGSPSARGVARLDAPGTFSGIKPGDLGVIIKCIADSVPVNVEWLELPTGPVGPVELGEFDMRAVRERASWVNSRLQMVERVSGVTQLQRDLMRDVIVAQRPG